MDKAFAFLPKQANQNICVCIFSANIFCYLWNVQKGVELYSQASPPDHGVTAPNPGQHYSIAPRLPGTHSWLVLLVTEFCIWSKKELLAKKVEKQFSDHKSNTKPLYNTILILIRLPEIKTKSIFL